MHCMNRDIEKKDGRIELYSFLITIYKMRIFSVSDQESFLKDIGESSGYK